LSLKRLRTITHGIRSVFNDPTIKKAVTIANNAAMTYAEFADNPTWWTGMKGGMSMLKVLADDQEVWAYDYFDDDEGWAEPFNRDFNGAFLKILLKYPHSDIKTSSDNMIVRLHEVEGITFGYVFSTKSTTRIDKIYCRLERQNDARELLRTMLWQQFEGKSLVMRKSDRFGMKNFDDDSVMLEVDEVYKAMASKRATEYSAYLKRCIDAGVNRSVMFYGPPGTGKSTTAKTIVETLGLRSFRIRVADAGGIDNSTLFESVRIFQPEAIIFDDFDRAHNQENLLETLEYFHDTVKLVIATVNRRDDLDEALLRPGRFDELECVKRMDDDIVKKVLGETNKDAFEIVKEWPIAFIQEYVKRTAFMSKEEAVASTEELAERVERLSQFDEETDNNKVLRHRKTTSRSGRSRDTATSVSGKDIQDVLDKFKAISGDHSELDTAIVDIGSVIVDKPVKADKIFFRGPKKNAHKHSTLLRRAFKRPMKLFRKEHMKRIKESRIHR